MHAVILSVFLQSMFLQNIFDDSIFEVRELKKQAITCIAFFYLVIACIRQEFLDRALLRFKKL